MATVYTIRGETALIAPFSQTWRRILIGRSHDQSALYSGNWEIDLLFDSASINMQRQWMEAASPGSLNMTVLNRFSVGWTDLSAVQLEVVDFPPVEAGVSLPWTLVVRGASINAA